MGQTDRSPGGVDAEAPGCKHDESEHPSSTSPENPDQVPPIDLSTLAGDVRSGRKLNDDDLRMSLKTVGWLKHLPGIQDEHGTLLVGNRRMKVCKEEGIEPVIETVTFGDGPEADAERMRLAVVSNIGAAPMTKAERKALAERMYRSGLTMQAIGSMLGVTHKTISLDLENCTEGTNSPRTKTATNPKGAGRPKDSGRTPRSTPQQHHPAHQVSGAHQPEIDPSTLPPTAQQKLEAAIQQHKRKLDAEYEKRTRELKADYERAERKLVFEFGRWANDEVMRRIKEVIIPAYGKQLEIADRVIKTRRGVFPRSVYRHILSCLESSQRKGVTDKKLDEAFRAFKECEDVLCREKEKEEPKFVNPLPRTAEELLKRRTPLKSETHRFEMMRKRGVQIVGDERRFDLVFDLFVRTYAGRVDEAHMMLVKKKEGAS